MNIGHNIGTMILTKSPKLIFNVSTTSIRVESHTCLQEEDLVLNTKSQIYKNLTKYYSSVTKAIDTKTI